MYFAFLILYVSWSLGSENETATSSEEDSKTRYNSRKGTLFDPVKFDEAFSHTIFDEIPNFGQAVKEFYKAEERKIIENDTNPCDDLGDLIKRCLIPRVK